ncbi:hypothetical protein LVJ94_31005 [Pendulispora rubella]|uniref:Uncharacterized protein n=1 Tax=Pendulispora rubella TaxID=2741070 RepID=A0ABZ2KWJ0_9BACT
MLIRVALAVVVLLSVAIARQYSIGARSMSASDAALSRGDAPAAIDEARAAAEARAPFSPYPDRGFERLTELAHSAEQSGNWADCARAWRAVRSAALSTRVTAGDGRPRVLEANVQLARIGARTRSDVSAATGETLTGAALEEHLREDLARDEHPSAVAYVALGAGGILFYVGVAGLLTGGPKRWPAKWMAALVAAGALLAILGCML